MKILITTLSLGENYTRDYTLRMIEDVLKMSDVDFYVTTDCKHVITDRYGDNNRINIREISREDVLVRLPIGPNKGANDFNFNMRYLCLEHVQDIDDSVVIFTDCDNSFDWWDKDKVETFINEMNENGFDFFGPRTSYRVSNVLSTFQNNCISKINTNEFNYDLCTIFWHKLYNFDMIDFENKTIKNFENHEWSDAGLPAEYLLIFNNREKKLSKMVSQWKYFHDYLVNRDFTYGTWAEGFEIGVSAYVAGFKDFDITFTHPLWNKIFTPNGYKTGPRGGIVHSTES
jgi:hypothetical protein